MNSTRRINISLPLLLILLMWFATTAASNWQWLTNSPLSSLSESDWKALSATLKSGLNSAPDGSTLHWNNTESGNGGRMTIQDMTDTPTPCRHVLFNTTSKPDAKLTTLIFCKTAEGKWMIDSNASRKP